MEVNETTGTLKEMVGLAIGLAVVIVWIATIGHIVGRWVGGQ